MIQQTTRIGNCYSLAVKVSLSLPPPPGAIFVLFRLLRSITNVFFCFVHIDAKDFERVLKIDLRQRL